MGNVFGSCFRKSEVVPLPPPPPPPPKVVIVEPESTESSVSLVKVGVRCSRRARVVI